MLMELGSQIAECGNMSNGDKNSIGCEMYKWATDLYPICRSITGDGVRQTLEYIKSLIPDLKIFSVPSGTKVFDWHVPDEWNICDAFIDYEPGERIIDFKKHNLHVVGYSEPVNRKLTLEELNEHLYSLEAQPSAIPYITSYYQKRWGFCLSHTQRHSLKKGSYHAYIDSELKPGVLNYGECILPGKTKKEIFLSTYVCHPSMANNELSGPVVTTALVKWLMSLQDRYYTYRIIFIPETIGSITYLSKHLEHLKRYVYAGFNITCIGDERCYSYLPSRNGNSISDKAALHVLKHIYPNFKRYSWLDRGSDERQYCAPGVDLPIATIMRSKYGEYPEYHTSLDDLSLVSPKGLQGGFDVLQKSIYAIENDVHLQTPIFCEPQLGKRGLYPTLSTKNTSSKVRDMMNLISYCDGAHSLLEIAERIGRPIFALYDVLEELIEHNIIKILGYENEVGLESIYK